MELRRCQSCGADCMFDGTDGEPCWGAVKPVDEWWLDDGTYGYYHVCRGHEGRYDETAAPYRAPPEA